MQNLARVNQLVIQNKLEIKKTHLKLDSNIKCYEFITNFCNGLTIKTIHRIINCFYNINTIRFDYYCLVEASLLATVVFETLNSNTKEIWFEILEKCSLHTNNY